MCTIAFVLQDVTMTTTGLMRDAGNPVRWIRHQEPRTELRPPRMNWVVVTDENHKRQMRMFWMPSATDR